MFMLAFDSGGRRRSEVTGLNVGDVDLSDFAAKGLIWLRLLQTKAQAPRLPLKGRAARAVVHWLEVTGRGGENSRGPLFCPVSTSGRPLPRRLASGALRIILRHRLGLADLPLDYASPHGLRADFLTKTALDRAPRKPR